MCTCAHVIETLLLLSMKLTFVLQGYDGLFHMTCTEGADRPGLIGIIISYGLYVEMLFFSKKPADVGITNVRSRYKSNTCQLCGAKCTLK